MGAPFILAAPNPGLVLAALNRAMTYVVSAIAARAAVAEVGRRKKTAKGTRTADKEAWQKAADDFARTGSFAEILKKAMERAQEDDCSRRKECPALKGEARWINRSGNPKLSIVYQNYITKFPPNIEWFFEDIYFDGFFPDRCELPEAKARYDQFFKNGQPKPFYDITNDYKIAKRQYDVTIRNPPTSLKWYFMTPVYYSYMKNYFLQNGLNIICVLDEMKTNVSD